MAKSPSRQGGGGGGGGHTVVTTARVGSTVKVGFKQLVNNQKLFSISSFIHDPVSQY